MVAVVVAALLLAGLVVPAGGSSVRGAFANLQLVSSVPGELTISWDLPDPQPSDYRIMWAEEGLGFLSYRFANEALRGNEYPDGEALSVTLTGLTEGATYRVKARSRYSSGGWNNSRWSGPWSNEVTASVSVAAPVAQEPGDDSQTQGNDEQQVDDPQTQGNDEQQVEDPQTQGNDEQQVEDPQTQGNDEQQVEDPQTQGNDEQQVEDPQTQGNDEQQVEDPQTQGNDEQQVEDPQTQGNDEQQGDDSQTQGNDEQQVEDPQTQGNDEQQVDDSQTQGDDSQTQGNDDQQGDDSSVVSGKSVEAGETVSEDGVSRSEPVGGDLLAGTDTVGVVAADSAALGTISEGFSLWDADWFAAELVAGSSYVIEVLGAGVGADCTLRGPVLERVYDVDGTAVVGTETWDDGRDSLTKLTFTPASPGTYFVSVAGEANAAGTGTYILALTAAGERSSERVAAIGAEGCVPTAPDKNADNNATSRAAPKKTAKPPPENNRITARSHNRTHNTVVTLASNTGRPHDVHGDIPSGGFDQAFITGPTEPGQNVNGYVLTKLELATVRINELTVSVWTDSTGSPGAKLAEQTITGDGTFSVTRIVAADGLDVFLLPGTKYWIRLEAVGQVSVSQTNTGAEDPETLAGWSIEGLVRFALKGFATAVRPLVSNSGQNSDSAAQNIPARGFDQSFMTGPSAAGQYGYVLTELEFFAAGFTRSDEMLVSVWTDSSGSRGENLVQRRLRGGGSTALARRVVDGLDVFLLPNAKYWIRFVGEVGSAALSLTNTDDEDSGGVAGWSIGGAPTDYPGPIRVGLSGFAATGGSSEPSGGDLAASEHTTGVVSVGQVSFGSLFVDDRVGVGARLVSVESFTRDRDWFKLVGLQRGRLYRVEVDFVGDGVVGGGIQMYQSTLGRTPVARSDMWDSNYDGNAVIDFRPIQSDRVVTKWIMIESPNGMGSDRFAARNFFTGDYTVTLTDITGLKTMVSNTEQREDDRLVHSDIGHLHDQEAEFLNHNREVATSFTTDSHSDGYALDSITAYMQPGRTAATATILATIEEIVDTHTEDDNIDESDLITFPEDSVDITLTSATIVSTIAEPAVSIHSDNGGEPGDKLCTLEGLDGYATGLGLSTGDWPDQLYAGGCADITLTASTTYWIVFGSSERLPSSYYLVGRATSTDEDPGNNAGWSIGDNAQMRLYTDIETGDWGESSYRLAVGVHATPN